MHRACFCRTSTPVWCRAACNSLHLWDIAAIAETLVGMMASEADWGAHAMECLPQLHCKGASPFVISQPPVHNALTLTSAAQQRHVTNTRTPIAEYRALPAFRSTKSLYSFRSPTYHIHTCHSAERTFGGIVWSPAAPRTDRPGTYSSRKADTFK